MQTFDFDRPAGRQGSGCVKWDDIHYDDLIPLWVADMDFAAAPCIQQALYRRWQHGVYGYEHVPERFYRSVMRWFEEEHGWSIAREAIIPVTGLVPSLNALFRELVSPGDQVIVQTPVYNGFLSSFPNNDIELVANPMVYADSRYTIDWDDLEQKAALPKTRMLLFCNPHNPGGRIWTREELSRVAAICRRHDLLLISDEIHCEVTPMGIAYTPMGTMDGIKDRLIVFTSPGKGFNLAGLGIANVVVPDGALRQRVHHALDRGMVTEVSIFGVTALQAAYDEGKEWLQAVNEYIGANYRFLCSYIHEHMPRLGVTQLEGTYLAWVNHSAFPYTSAEVEQTLLHQYHVRVSAGTFYSSDGEGFMRINLACPRAQLEEGLKRMIPIFT